ncbi:uncharacterized protein LOC130966829 [Arachis stenosperma]|uniref:uncharacterized protein LOC130966829 n=1 Tax=Arachis stenosperma TaxID=217475 RepID=UPI0025AD16B0|nr:uncharacterized protein LOC130966829 [Arachis stenosperma]
MAALRRVTIQEAGAPDFTLQPYQAHHPGVAADFELKTALLNLMPKFHGLPAQEPIKHLRDFQAVCSTVRHDGADETFILLKAFPFSLEGKAREWYYAQPRVTVANWNTLRREFLEKIFPTEVTDRLRKEISMIVQGESETLHEYWERFNNLLEACPHHMIEKLVLLGYFTQGMKPQDKTTLEGASNGDLAESTRNHRQRQGHSKAITEVSSSKETTALTQSICEMTNLLKQIQLSQQQAQQAQPFLPQQNQQLIPQRQIMENNLTSTLNGLNSTLQALVSQIGSLNNSNNQPLSPSGIPSQPLPNSKGGINAITLRSGTTLQGRNPEEPSPLEHAPADDMVEVEDVEEEDEAQGMAEAEAA